MIPAFASRVEALNSILQDCWQTFLNIMDQYRPCHKAYDFPELSRGITGEEYQDAVAAAQRAGLARCDGVAE